MRNTRVTAIVLAAFMLILPLSMVVSASDEDEGSPIMVSVPQVADDGSQVMPVGVYFADNMVYGPQWRIGNFVRIEMMVLNMTDYSVPDDIYTSDFELFDDYNKIVTDPETGLEEVVYDGDAQQDAIMTSSTTILPKTRMVSVSYIKVTITFDGKVVDVLDAGWNPVGLEKVIDNGLGREVNKAGHLIYGTLWDTDGLAEGSYTVNVELGAVEEISPGVWVGNVGEWYSVEHAMANFYIGEDLLNDPDHPFVDLAMDPLDPMYVDYKIGFGNCTDGVAWVVLGDLIPQGSGGGNSDEGGGNQGEGGNGNGGSDALGQNGNCNGRRK